MRLLGSNVRCAGPAATPPPPASGQLYIGIPTPTSNVPGAIMPTLPTGADTPGFPYDPINLAKPTTGDVADWNSASNYYYCKYNGNDGTAGNGGNGNPTNPRLTLPTGTISAGTVIFVEGAGVARPTAFNDGVGTKRNFDEFSDWSLTLPTFNSGGTYSDTSDICWVVGINDPRIRTTDGDIANCYHIIFDGVIMDDGTGDNRGGRMRPNNCHYMTFRNGAQYGPSSGSDFNTGGAAYQMTDCTYNMYYNNTMAWFGAWEVIGDPDFHGWRPQWGNRWVWCIDNTIKELKGDSTQVGNSNNAQTADRNSHYVYFGGNTCSNNQENAVDCKNSSHVIISQNTCFDFDGAGGGGANSTAIILSQDGEGPHSNHHWAIANTIYDAGVGIRMSGNNEDGNSPGSGEPTVTDRDYAIGNIVYDCSSAAFSISHGAASGRSGQRHEIINNTASRCANLVTVNLFQPSATSNVYVDGNIAYEMTGDEVDVVGNNGLDILSVTDNVLFKTGGGEVIDPQADVNTNNTLGSDPLFTDEPNNDYYISSDTSPAYQKTDENAAYQEFEDLYGIDIRKDINGTVRPQGSTAPLDQSWEAGALERLEA